jgi:hypothetical protein
MNLRAVKEKKSREALNRAKLKSSTKKNMRLFGKLIAKL